MAKIYQKYTKNITKYAKNITKYKVMGGGAAPPHTPLHLWGASRPLTPPNWRLGLSPNMRLISMPEAPVWGVGSEAPHRCRAPPSPISGPKTHIARIP